MERESCGLMYGPGPSSGFCWPGRPADRTAVQFLLAKNSPNKVVSEIANRYLQLLGRLHDFATAAEAKAHESCIVPSNERECKEIAAYIPGTLADARQLIESGEPRLAESMLETALTYSLECAGVIRARVHSELALLLCNRGEMDGALSNCTDAIAIAEALPGSKEHQIALAWAYYAMGVYLLTEKKSEISDSFLSRCEQILEEIEHDDEEIAAVVYRRALVAADRSDFETAAELCHDALIRMAPEDCRKNEDADPGNFIPFQTLGAICGHLLLFTIDALPEGVACSDILIHQAARRSFDVSKVLKSIMNNLAEPIRTELMLSIMKLQSQLAIASLFKSLKGSELIADDALFFARKLFPPSHPELKRARELASAAKVKKLADSGAPEGKWQVGFSDVLAYAAIHWERIVQSLADEYRETMLCSPADFIQWARDSASEDEGDREMAECHFTHLSFQFQTEGIVEGQCAADFYLAVIAAIEGNSGEASQGFADVCKTCSDEFGEDSPVTKMVHQVRAYCDAQQQIN